MKKKKTRYIIIYTSFFLILSSIQALICVLSNNQILISISLVIYAILCPLLRNLYRLQKRNLLENLIEEQDLVGILYYVNVYGDTTIINFELDRAVDSLLLDYFLRSIKKMSLTEEREREFVLFFQSIEAIIPLRNKKAWGIIGRGLINIGTEYNLNQNLYLRYSLYAL